MGCGGRAGRAGDGLTRVARGRWTGGRDGLEGGRGAARTLARSARLERWLVVGSLCAALGINHRVALLIVESSSPSPDIAPHNAAPSSSPSIRTTGVQGFEVASRTRNFTMRPTSRVCATPSHPSLGARAPTTPRTAPLRTALPSSVFRASFLLLVNHAPKSAASQGNFAMMFQKNCTKNAARGTRTKRQGWGFPSALRHIAAGRARILCAFTPNVM